jgi:TPR repeat protein
MRLFCLALLLSSPALAAPSQLETALDAHARSDFAAARAILLSLAARGSPVAETLLGGMAARGQGIAANPATAAAWWLRAARRGYAPAQVALANALAEGRGVAQDPQEAWLWATRASRSSSLAGEQARDLAGRIAARLTPAERQRLLRDL